MNVFWAIAARAGDSGQNDEQGPSDLMDFDLEDLLGFGAAELDAMDLEAILRIRIASASKTEQTQSQVPSVVDVITARQIELRGYRTVLEALRHAAGIHVIDDHVYHHVGIRGVFASPESPTDTLKLMINGQPVSFRASAANFFGHELLPIEAVGRLEVIRGPGSALYGGGALLGFINVITRDRLDARIRDSHNLHVEAGTRGRFASPDGLALTALSEKTLGDLRLLLSATLERCDRSGLVVPGAHDMVREQAHSEYPEIYAEAQEFPSPGSDPRERRRFLRNSPSRKDTSLAGSFYGSLGYQLGDRSSVHVDGHIQYSDRHGEFLGFSYLTHETRFVHRNGFARFQYTLGPPADGHGLSIKAAVALATGEPGAKELVVDPTSPSLRKRRSMGYRAVDLSLEFAYRLSSQLGFVGGVDSTYDREDLVTPLLLDKNNGKWLPEDGFGEEVFGSVGAYAQSQLSPLDGLQLTLGARLDHNTAVACDSRKWRCLVELDDQPVTAVRQSDPEIIIRDRGALQLSIRAAAVYNTGLYGLYGKIIYGSSFKPPSPYQLYHDRLTLIDSRGTPWLRPQTADTVDVVIGAQPAARVHVRAGAYYTRVDNFVVLSQALADSVVKARNADVDIAGFELGLDVAWRALTGYVNVNHIFRNDVAPRRLDDESSLAWKNFGYDPPIDGQMYPNTNANLGACMQFDSQGINANVDLRIVGPRRASYVNSHFYAGQDRSTYYELPGYFVFDVTLSSDDIEIATDHPTRFFLVLRDMPRGYSEPGYGGIDIPSLGPRILLRVQQAF